MHTLTVNFWSGSAVETTQLSEILPGDEYNAQAIAWGIIRKWFQDNNMPIPEYVRNVSILGFDDFKWDLLDLTSSAEWIP